MRVALTIAGLLVLLVFAPTAPAQDNPLSIPGSGITITPPPGTALAPVGPTLIDAAGETIVIFLTTSEALNPENNPVWNGVFPHAAERVKSTIEGNLRRRTRAADGGGWDGFMLTSVRDGRALQVMAMYTGSSPEAFERLSKHLGTVTWDPAIGDPELAAGVAFKFKGLKVVKGSIGGISYNTSGELGAKGTGVQVQPMPVPVNKEGAIFPSNCDKVLTAALGGAKHKPPETKTLAAHSYCDVWTETPEAEGKYIALVRLKTGGLLTVLANAAAKDFATALPEFRKGVAEMRVLRVP